MRRLCQSDTPSSCSPTQTAAHQLHQLFGFADLLGDGHQLVVAHEQNFEGEAEQVFWQNGQQVSAVERNQTFERAHRNWSEQLISFSKRGNVSVGPGSERGTGTS